MFCISRSFLRPRLRLELKHRYWTYKTTLPALGTKYTIVSSVTLLRTWETVDVDKTETTASATSALSSMGYFLRRVSTTVPWMISLCVNPGLILCVNTSFYSISNKPIQINWLTHWCTGYFLTCYKITTSRTTQTKAFTHWEYT